jgi:DMSO/TMAO reductase YedYZ molybdopterin-dependent catalytic subunit
LRRTALLAPHGQAGGSGPGGFQVNVTIAESGVTTGQTGAGWRLALTRAGAAASTVILTRAELLAMPQHTAHLAINCVEGWSTGDQEWTGVRLRDLARLAGAGQPANVLVESLQHGGAFSRVVLSAGQVMDPDSLLALRVNGADLSPDHGYPARVIVPASPGVHNTKWVAAMTFTS